MKRKLEKITNHHLVQEKCTLPVWSHLGSCQLQLYIIWYMISPVVMLQV